MGENIADAIRDITCTRLKAFAAMQLELAAASPSDALRNHLIESAKLMMEASSVIKAARTGAPA